MFKLANHIRPWRRLQTILLLLSALMLLLLCPVPAHAQSIDNGLVGYWPFDEGRGSTSADLSGSGNTATLHTPDSFTNNTAPTDFANPAALASVNSANSYATAPGNKIDNLQQLTLAFWVRINWAAPFPAMTLVSLNNGKAGFGYYDQGNLYFDINVNGLPRRLFKLSSTIADGAYHHIAGSYDGAAIRFYYDGALYNTLDTTGGALLAGQGVSFSAPDAPLNGVLDDVRLYNRALTASEVAGLVYNCNTVQDIPGRECRALVGLAISTGPWTTSTQWFANNTPCTWFGVLCNNGHVIVLNLPQNHLAGPLPAALGNLPELLVLNLSNNGLRGDLPLELGNLGKLETLDLYGNQLGGALPVTLGNLARLKTLRLYNNQLRGAIPSQLTKLTSLLTLDLGYNRLRTEEPALLNFLTTHQPDWAASQTVAPSTLRATVPSATSVALTWQPISYTADVGYYEVFMAPQAAGPYTRVGVTADKLASSLTVTDLPPGVTRYFLVRTFTAKHGLQQNDLLSDSTDPVAVTLTVNQPPVATNDSYTTPQDGALTVDAAHGLLANDSDPDGTPLQIGSISSVTPGSQLALNLDGSFTYTPAPGFVGTETFTYQASDGQALSNPATVAFQVTANTLPVATLTLVLDVQPDSKSNFRFAGSLGAFQLDDFTPQDNDAFSSSKTFTVPAGVYTVTATMLPGYLDANISCNPPANTIADLAKHQLVINASSGANVTCTFAVQRAGQIIAGKYDDRNHNHQRNNHEAWLNNWQMQLYSPFGPQPTLQTTAGEGRTLFPKLFAGQYTVCEVQQTGWFAITPNTLNTTYNAPCYTVTLAAGQAVWVRFGNSNTPLVTAAEATPVEDIVVCDLPATDDDGNELTVERDPWEEEEQAATTIFLPLVTQ